MIAYITRQSLVKLKQAKPDSLDALQGLCRSGGLNGCNQLQCVQCILGRVANDALQANEITKLVIFNET